MKKNNDNDWTELMRWRLADSKADVPDGLWNRIEDRLDAMPEETGSKPVRHRVWRIAAWVATAAAVAALFVLEYKISVDEAEECGGGMARMEGNAANVCRTVAVSGTDGDNHLAMATAENVVSCGVQPNIANEAILSKPSEGHIGNVTNEQSGNAQYEQLENTTNEQTVNNQADCYGNAQVEQSGTPHDDYHKEPLVAMGNAFADYAAQRNAEKSAGTRWTVAAHTDGTFGSTQSESHPLLAAAYESMGSDGTCYFVNSNQLLQASRYKEIKHHAQPVSFGLSVGYAFTDRLSLNSGLVYTRAESELSNVSGNDEIVSKQRLHYVGVPLSLKFTVWGNRYVQTYAIGGGQADFNVSATTTTSGVSRDSDRDRVQFSAGAAVGVQLNVLPETTPQIGIYAEPGVRYYFDNNSKVETIFKEKPCRFNLQVGVRFGF